MINGKKDLLALINERADRVIDTEGEAYAREIANNFLQEHAGELDSAKDEMIRDWILSRFESRFRSMGREFDSGSHQLQFEPLLKEVFAATQTEVCWGVPDGEVVKYKAFWKLTHADIRAVRDMKKRGSDEYLAKVDQLDRLDEYLWRLGMVEGENLLEFAARTAAQKSA